MSSIVSAILISISNTKYFCRSISNTNTRNLIHKVFQIPHTQSYFVFQITGAYKIHVRNLAVIIS